MAKIQAAFESRFGDPHEAAGHLETFLGEDEDPEQFWESVATNLKAGKLRLIFVADVIPSELKRIVEFLNEQMDRTEVLALEVRQYVEYGGSRLTLVPRLIGETEAAKQRKGTATTRSKRVWGEADVLRGLRDQYSTEVAERMIALYEFLRDAGARPSWGTGKKPSVNMWLGEDRDPARSNPVCVGLATYWVQLAFNFLRDRRSPHELARLASLVREIHGAPPSLEGLEESEFRMQGGMNPEEVLATDEALETFKRVVLEAAAPTSSPPTA